jgi:ankyrin repeat protein
LGADVKAQDDYKYTPAHYATRNDHVHCLKRLRNFEGDKKVRNETNSSEPLIITAAKYDSEDVALWLLESGESTEVRCKDGMTPLHYATINDSRNVTFLLIRHGADVNSKDNNLLSPLHYAVLKRRTDIGILLLAWEADLHAETKEHLTPLHLVAKEDELDFLKVLLFHGGNILAPTASNKGDYPIHIAATYGSDNVLQWMLETGISVNITNAVGCTPLLNIARSGNLMMAKVLLEKGADVNVKVTGEDSRTCLHAACLCGNVEMVRLLLENEADPDASTSTNMRTPLHWAAQKGHLEIMKILVKFGANISARDKFGLTPRYLAAQKCHDKVVEFLTVVSVTKRSKPDAL